MNTDIMALVKDIQDRVREVAYLMWESAGRQHGMAMEYWLSAEREVITTMQSASERMMPEQLRGAGEAESSANAAEPAPAGDAKAEPAAAPGAPATDEAPAKAAPAATKAKRATAAKTSAAKADDGGTAKPASPKSGPRKTTSRSRAKPSAPA